MYIKEFSLFIVIIFHYSKQSMPGNVIKLTFAMVFMHQNDVNSHLIMKINLYMQLLMHEDVHYFLCTFKF